VLIGKDTRISGYMLESALESGFNSAGVDVVLLGRCRRPPWPISPVPSGPAWAW
jgi:phosphoglucosamine mutase